MILCDLNVGFSPKTPKIYTWIEVKLATVGNTKFFCCTCFLFLSAGCCAFLSRELCCGADCTSSWCAFTLEFWIYGQKLTFDTYHVTSCCVCVFLALQNLLSFWLLMTSTRLALWRLSCFFGDHFVVILALVVFVLVVLFCKFCFGFSLTNYCVLLVCYVDNEICS